MSVLIEKTTIIGILDSGIYLSRQIPINLTDSYIGWCRSENGACIFANCSVLSLTRSCLSSSHATNYGSSLVTYANFYFDMSTIFRCSPDEHGNDDNANIDGNIAHMSDVNFSNNNDNGASGYQIRLVSSCTISRVLHMNGHYNPEKDSLSTIFEYIELKCSIILNECVFANNTQSLLVSFNMATLPFGLKSCVLYDNKFGYVLGIYSDNFPQITFEDVSILDGTPIGIDSLNYKSDGTIPIMKVGFRTAECVGFFNNRFHESVLKSKVDSSVLKATVMIALTNSL